MNTGQRSRTETMSTEPRDSLVPLTVFQSVFRHRPRRNYVRTMPGAEDGVPLSACRSIARRVVIRRPDSPPPDAPDHVPLDGLLDMLAMTADQARRLADEGVLELTPAGVSLRSVHRLLDLVWNGRVIVSMPPTSALLDWHGLSRVAAPILSAVVPALRLEPSSTPRRSKLGGKPDLDDRPWPTWNNRLLSFVAQLDLVELARVWPDVGLPDTGLLSFFYDALDQPSGSDPRDRGSCQVLWITGPVSGRDLPENDGHMAEFDEVFLAPRRQDVLPDRFSTFLDELELDDDETSRYEDLHFEVAGNSPDHRVMGHPLILQNDDVFHSAQLASNGVDVGDPSWTADERVPALLAGVKEWLLLLQVTADDYAGMGWGDDGVVYFCIRREDLAAGRFDRCWAVSQAM